MSIDGLYFQKVPVKSVSYSYSSHVLPDNGDVFWEMHP